MNKRKICKVFAACLGFSIFASSVYASCTPAVIVVRHAEDEDQDGVHELTSAGKSHARAYQSYLPQLLDQLKDKNGNSLCPIQHFVTSDRGSLNPFRTVKKLAELRGEYKEDENGNVLIDRIVSTFDGIPLTPGAQIWKNINFLSSLVTSDTSTFMAASKEALWDNGMDSNSVLTILSNNDETKSYLRNTNEPFYDFVYIFTDQDPTTKKFNHADMYLQLYKQKIGSTYTTNDPYCVFKIKDDPQYDQKDNYGNYIRKIVITNLEVLHHTTDNYTDLTARFHCIYQ